MRSVFTAEYPSTWGRCWFSMIFSRQRYLKNLRIRALQAFFPSDDRCLSERLKAISVSAETAWKEDIFSEIRNEIMQSRIKSLFTVFMSVFGSLILNTCH